MLCCLILSSKEQHAFKTEIFCNHYKKSIHVFQEKKKKKKKKKKALPDPKLLNRLQIHKSIPNMPITMLPRWAAY